MPRRPNAAPLVSIAIDPARPQPLYLQLYHEVREGILTRRLVPEALMPSSRSLARELGLARATVVSAFEQLVAEGYLVARAGSGYRVAPQLPQERWEGGRPLVVRTTALPPGLSARGALMASAPTTGISSTGPVRPFRVGVPALDAFPLALWTQLAARRQRQLELRSLDVADPGGEAALREAIAAYVYSARGVTCMPEQVIVCTGSQQALDFIARLLLDPGDAVWVEDPGYLAARSSLQVAGAQIVPVPVDDEGIVVAAGVTRSPQARLAYVTPAHHYPLGVAMSLSRRLALLEWAAQQNAWVLEGDYDGEYRYTGRPLTALQALAPERVCYFGTFSKTLFPTMRLGYVIVPPALVEPVLAARQLVDLHAPVVEQLIVADFIAGGHFARHVREMRVRYAARQELLATALTRRAGDLITVERQPAGMQLVVWLPEGSDDRALSRQLLANGIEAPSLSSYCIEVPRRPALLLGFAGVPEAALEPAVEQAVAVITGYLRNEMEARGEQAGRFETGARTPKVL